MSTHPYISVLQKAPFKLQKLAPLCTTKESQYVGKVPLNSFHLNGHTFTDGLEKQNHFVQRNINKQHRKVVKGFDSDLFSTFVKRLFG